jgi:hypothetical protein
MEENVLEAQDAQGHLYDVSSDHTLARVKGTEDWRDIADIRMIVGPLYLRSPNAETDG